MIELPGSAQSSTADLRIKVIGLGGAGNHLLNRLQRDGVPATDLVVLDTDSQMFESSEAALKVLLGTGVAQGLGTGGDPELGYRAAEESAEEIRASIDGADLLFVCMGLGGGTGSGAAALVAAYGQEQEALVIVFATMPFSFEGERRRALAEETLATLESYADLVICFENDKMASTVSAGTELREAFAMADLILSQAMRSITALMRRRGLIHAGFAQVAAALRAQNARALFGLGEADGTHRALTALERALQSPLMDRGRLLSDVHNVLIHVAAGRNLTLDEVQLFMTEFNRHIGERTRILFSAAIDPMLGERLSIVIVSALGEPIPVEVGVPRRVPAHLEIKKAEPIAPPVVVEAYSPLVTAPLAGLNVRNVSRTTEESDDIHPPQRLPEPAQVQFEPATRGRFEKSEPTIVDGQDLDVPTFLRRNARPGQGR
ncbi:MAG: Cell division protein FtsZ [Chthoniobacteraceae bacterium]|nr:Cell division protein FtsZ [Chthoniobacteraceae bacterium]